MVSQENEWRYPMTRFAGMQRKIGGETLSWFAAARASASLFLDHFGPEPES
jgi:hypothetical protein